MCSAAPGCVCTVSVYISPEMYWKPFISSFPEPKTSFTTVDWNKVVKPE